jgi:hypothetical protein
VRVRPRNDVVPPRAGNVRDVMGNAEEQPDKRSHNFYRQLLATAAN